MSVFVKICGICSGADLEQISALGPDALGFVFWDKSKRNVDPEQVGEWYAPESIKRVGVFVNPSEEELLSVCASARLDVVQVHRISPEWRVDRARFSGVEFWNAVEPDQAVVAAFSFDFDRFLLDSYDPVTVGGTGNVCDWAQAAAFIEQSAKPVLLAGGLAPDNVQDAVEAVRPWGVDVSSRVEFAPGKKNIPVVAQFISAARSAD